MKSLLVADSVTTAMPSNGLTGLKRGQLICLNSKGEVVANSAQFQNAEMIQFVLGLGNGATKTSVWVNPITAKINVQEYVVPGQIAYEFTNITLPSQLKYGDELVVSFNLQDPKFKDTYHHNVYDAVYVVDRDGLTATKVLSGLKKEIDKTIETINGVYGADALTVTPASGTMITATLKVEGREGLFFSVKMEGVAQSKVTVTSPDNLFGEGVGVDVVEMEKAFAVQGDGYNPSVRRPDEWYGDIFTANASKTYKFYKVESKSPQTHVFGMDSVGMITTSIIAFDAGATSTTLDELFNNLSEFSECEKDTATTEP